MDRALKYVLTRPVYWSRTGLFRMTAKVPRGITASYYPRSEDNNEMLCFSKTVIRRGKEKERVKVYEKHRYILVE